MDWRGSGLAQSKPPRGGTQKRKRLFTAGRLRETEPPQSAALKKPAQKQKAKTVSEGTARFTLAKTMPLPPGMPPCDTPCLLPVFYPFLYKL